MKSTNINFLFLLLLFITLFFSALPAAAQQAPSLWIQNGIFEARPTTRQITLTGYTRSRHVLDIVSEEEGRCISVSADTGDEIGSDGVFAELDPTFINLAIEKNKVDQKRLENMIAYQNKEVGRYKKLVARETAAQSKLDGLQNNLDQSNFQLKALRLEEATLKERRSRYHIQVPPGWSIIERTVEPGQWVSVGKHLGKAADFRTLLIPFSLSPEEMNALKNIDGPVDLRFPDENQEGITLKSSLERISPAFDPETRKMSVDLAVNKGLSTMRGGLRAELTLELPDASGAVLVPTSAVTERYEESWLTRENGRQVSVVLLGHGPQGTSRVKSPEVNPGDRFTVKPGP